VEPLGIEEEVVVDEEDGGRTGMLVRMLYLLDGVGCGRGKERLNGLYCSGSE